MVLSQKQKEDIHDILLEYIDTNERLFNTLDEVVSIIESVEEDSDGITAINIIDTLNDNIALQSQALEANERIMELINVL